MKYLKYLFVVGTILIAPSHTTTSRLSEGIDPGNLIPDFAIHDKAGNEMKMSDLRGQKVLVNFWAVYDAGSHMKNVLLSNTLQKAGNGIKLISVAFDQSEAIFERTLEMDGIGREYQFVDTLGRNSAIYKRHRLEKGFKNYLVDENGLIVAVDVKPDDLKDY